MRKYVIPFCFLFVLGVSFVACAAETAEQADAVNMLGAENTHAIGINDFPWDVDGATTVSLRWWKDQNNGKQLVLGSMGCGKEKFKVQYEDQTDQAERKGCVLSGFRYYWLERAKIGRNDNMYGIWGKGFGLYCNGSQQKANETYADETMQQGLEIVLVAPVGVEHFFLKRYPNISYSIQIDLCGGLSHDKITEISNYGVKTTTNDNFFFDATPRFAINYYFK